ncbi:inositol monophosphatase [Candidatus Woesearchaeota archaeon]|nr:inositol monophosphatase [Candidatus Woesearchaeota archaeon]
MIEASEMMETALEAAKGAGEIIMKYFDKEKQEITKGDVDYVTIADTECEKLIVSKIKEKFPDHNIITEESGDFEKSSDYVWLIDPLDGTANYVMEFPYFCTSIALKHKGETLLGVVYEPLVDLLFTAEKGKGAFVNGKRMQVSKTRNLNDSVMVLGVYKGYVKKIGKWDNTKNIFSRVMDNVRDFRRTGSSVLDFCYIALGKFDARIWFGKPTPWDPPAGELMIREAGGKVMDFKNNELSEESEGFIASNGLVHNELLKIVKEEW